MDNEHYTSLKEIHAVLMDRAKILRELSDQVFHIETQIKKIANCLLEFEDGLELAEETYEDDPRIIPFPGTTRTTYKPALPRKEESEPENGEYNFIVPVLAPPETKMPKSLPDFRPYLQRDGLILLSWDKKIMDNKELYTAYWVTSSGQYRYYASLPLKGEDFVQAKPHHKSYAAEDGVEFFGENNPCYIVHIAPELMISCRGRDDLRPDHIKTLKRIGVMSDFDYRFTLKASRLGKSAG